MPARRRSAPPISASRCSTSRSGATSPGSATAPTDRQEYRVPPEDLLDLFAIDPAAKDAPAPGRPEPVLPGGPMFVEFAEPERLDPARASAAAEPPPPTAARRWLWPAGLAGSIGVHMLPLLLLLAWRGTPSELPQPIP